MSAGAQSSPAASRGSSLVHWQNAEMVGGRIFFATSTTIVSRYRKAHMGRDSEV
jgi:hypothetical protein